MGDVRSHRTKRKSRRETRGPSVKPDVQEICKNTNDATLPPKSSCVWKQYRYLYNQTKHVSGLNLDCGLHLYNFCHKGTEDILLKKRDPGAYTFGGKGGGNSFWADAEASVGPTG